MIVSYKWLQTYFEGALPAPRELGLLLNTRAFEVEGIETIGDDFSIDIDVQPNRAHDCLCHYGIAKEIGALTGLQLKPIVVNGPTQEASTEVPAVLSVEIAPETACTRYISKQINGITLVTTPAEIAARLAVLKQRSINSVVDIANYEMFEVGQPLHVFDADKIVGGTIFVRPAVTGEMMTTLDGIEVTFAGGETVIADAEGVLAIAGIKGGTRAEVTAETKNIVLEAANFDASTIRRTSSQLGISTDASKRFERAISPTIAGFAMQRFFDLLRKCVITDASIVYASVDVYPRPVGTYKTGVSLREVNEYLGTSLSDKEVTSVFDRLGFSYTKVVPHEQVVEQAVALVGKAPYRYGASVLYDAPRAFDCSSFTSYLYKEAGVSIPRVTVDQYVWGTEITEAELQPGDLVFCDLGSSAMGADKQFYHETTTTFMKGAPVGVQLDHNGVYIGNGEVVHASSKADNTVARQSLATSEIFSHIVGYRRMATLGEPRYVITVPDERLDIRIPADVIEEIARVHGYEHIVPAPISSQAVPVVDKIFEYCNHLRAKLYEAGFSEVMTSTFTSTGDIEAVKAMASDKAFLRTNLRDAMLRTVSLNEKLVDLLGVDRVRAFEIGSVFTNDGEALRLAIGVSGKKADAVVNEMLDTLGLKATVSDGVAEVALTSDIITDVPHVTLPTNPATVYAPFSPFPFMVRDIALWVPGTDRADELLATITAQAGELLVHKRLFDIFEKDGRTSYAFRLVFQASDRTLTDVEVNTIMERITKTFVEEQGFEVR